MEEIWRDIVGYEGLYQVSNYGRVRSLDREIEQKSRWGDKITKKYEGKVLCLKLTKNTKRTSEGYLQAHLWKNGKSKNYSVHRLVYETFIGEIPKGMQINHINEIHTDNRLENLNIMTPKENNNYGTRNKKVAETLAGRKRPPEIFEKLRRPIEAVSPEDGAIVYSFTSISEAERNGFSRTAIKACVKNRYWNNKGKNIYKDLIWRYAQ